MGILHSHTSEPLSENTLRICMSVFSEIDIDQHRDININEALI